MITTTLAVDSLYRLLYSGTRQLIENNGTYYDRHTAECRCPIQITVVWV